GTVSLLFWYIGLIPDLATIRDRGGGRLGRWLAGLFSLGWRGSARHWRNYQKLYLLLAGLATPLVVSVHSIVSFDFAVGMVPGWHSTIFPPYFVAGAIYSGFAMVLTIAVPLRRALRLHDIITLRHFDAMAKVTLVAGLFVAYGYVMEYFTAWYSGEEFERTMVINRATGPYAPQFWTMMICNVGVLHLLWFKKIRTSPLALFVVSLLINLGMWLERYVIVVTSLHRDFMPSAWGMFSGTLWDWALVVGTLGLFGLFTLLFVRFIPVSSIAELRELVHEENKGAVEQESSSQTGSQAGSQQPKDPSLEPFEKRPKSERQEPPAALLAEFPTAERLKQAAEKVRDEGYEGLDAYVPFPVKGLDSALGLPKSRMAPIVLAGAVLGGTGAYFLQWYSSVIDYPHNIGGRPLHSWPSFLPLTFELAVLGGALFGVVGLLVLNQLPKLHHPVFQLPSFARASHDRYFLSVPNQEPKHDLASTRRLIASLEPVDVQEVTR
ncbi:MAG: quinol:electron acceptor oxidoreductase subunit ActD, partial [Myxococcota bacterium]